MATIAFRQVRWVDPVAGREEVVDRTWDGTRRAFVEPVENPERVIDGQGRLVLGPAFTDLYATSGEPGNEERESLATLAGAARAGGYCRVGILPDTQPPVDDPAQVEFLRKGLSQFGIEPLVYGAISQGLSGGRLAEAGYLSEAGVAGFTDNRPVRNWALLRRFLDYARVLERPVLLWPQIGELANGVAIEGSWSVEFGLMGIPVQAETIALLGMLELVRLTGTPVHCMRISTARSVELLRSARADGLPVTASVTIHHLAHASPNLIGYDPCLRFSPPLGNPEDRTALVAGLADGTLDGVASDHTPWTYEEKILPFSQAPSGAIGLELVLPLLWRQVEAGSLSAVRAWQTLSTGPEAVLGIAGDGCRALALFDPDLEWIVEAATLKSRSSATAWLGKTMKGRVVSLFC